VDCVDSLACRLESAPLEITGGADENFFDFFFLLGECAEEVLGFLNTLN
jgi:hypothetical protein